LLVNVVSLSGLIFAWFSQGQTNGW